MIDHGEPDVLDENEIAFLLCVEANRLAPQAQLLCESIRTFAGRYRNAPIVAVSPAPTWRSASMRERPSRHWTWSTSSSP